MIVTPTHRDSKKYLEGMVDKHGVRLDPLLTWKAPRRDEFLSIANNYRECIKGYADKFYSMQQLMRNKGKKIQGNERAQDAIENIRWELCEAPVLGKSTEKGMYVLDTDASVVAISGIMRKEQEWNRRTVPVPLHTAVKYRAIQR